MKDLITAARRPYSGDAQWAAWFGNLSANASTKAAAVVAVVEKLQDLARHTGQRAYVWHSMALTPPGTPGNPPLTAKTRGPELTPDTEDRPCPVCRDRCRRRTAGGQAARRAHRAHRCRYPHSGESGLPNLTASTGLFPPSCGAS